MEISVVSTEWLFHPLFLGRIGGIFDVCLPPNQDGVGTMPRSTEHVILVCLFYIQQEKCSCRQDKAHFSFAFENV